MFDVFGGCPEVHHGLPCGRAVLWRGETSSAASNLALYLERKVKPRRARPATKLTLVLLSTLLAWREALTVVQPDTFIRWHRKGFRLFWSRKSNALMRNALSNHPPGVFRFPDSAE